MLQMGHEKFICKIEAKKNIFNNICFKRILLKKKFSNYKIYSDLALY